MTSHQCDVVVVGSGAGGAVIAHHLAEAGFKVVLCEAGSYVRTAEFTDDLWLSLKRMFWDNGLQYAPGRPTVPFLQGRTVGGTTVVNSAISWDLPRDVYDEWVHHEAFDVPYDEIEAEQARLRRDLNIQRVDPAIQGANNDLMARGAEQLGWKGQAVDRNEKNCQGSGHCVVGCPHGAKLSMELSYVPWAMEKGMELIPNCEVERVLIEKGAVVGVEAKRLKVGVRQRRFLPKRGQRITIRAKRVVIAAGVIQSPLLLQRSHVADPHKLIGSHLMAHPGVSSIGLFDERVNLWKGATQGYEVTEFMDQGLKLESLGVPPALFGLRLPGVGNKLAQLMERRGHMVLWAIANRAQTLGSVRSGRLISPIRYPLKQADLDRFLLGIRLTGELMFAAGARVVYPDIAGRTEAVHSVEELHAVTRDPIPGTHMHPVATHLFGTCRLSADPARGVINDKFESHHVKGLYVADGSVFPSNTGVNPQLAIMALAGVAAKRVAESL